MNKSIVLFFTSVHLLEKSLSTDKAIIIISSLSYNLRAVTDPIRIWTKVPTSNQRYGQIHNKNRVVMFYDWSL